MKEKPYRIINIGCAVPLYQVESSIKDLYITCTSKVFSSKEDAIEFAERVHKNLKYYSGGRNILL